MPARGSVLGALAATSCILAGGCSSIGSPTAGENSASATATATARTAATAAASSSATSPLAIARRTHEYPPAHPPHQHAQAAGASAMAALHNFAGLYINWDARTVTEHMRALARTSIGQARAEMQLAAANTAQDYELRRGGIVNSGTVEAIAALRGTRDRYVVVTLERTTASNTNAYDGLRPAWHVALATVVQESPGAWVVSSWLPEN
ncbi:MAG: hypothetical protein ACR2HD_05860 [Solirubrobacteraceae bacterium]